MILLRTALWKRQSFFGVFYLTYFWVITLGYIWVIKGKNLQSRLHTFREVFIGGNVSLRNFVLLFFNILNH